MAYIFDGVRSPIGRGSNQKGGLRNITPFNLLKQLWEAIQVRNGFEERDIDEIILGCVSQVMEQGGNIAKATAAYIGNYNIPGTTINNYCSSGMAALGMAVSKTIANMSSISLVGGVEMLSRVPMYADKASIFTDPKIMEATRFTQMGCAADLISTIHDYTREEMDEYAVLSHNRAANARDNGYFDKSLVPIKNEEGAVVLAQDENIRKGLKIEDMEKFEPIFERFVTPFIRQKMNELYLKGKALKPLHHVGISPNLADGGSLLLVGTKEAGEAMGLKPRAKIIDYSVKAVEPIKMLTGGQKAVEDILKRNSYYPNDIALHYYAEAFASTCLKYQRELNIPIEKFNPNGGTMSMGHAQGCSGASLTLLMLDEMERTDKKLGIASISGLAMGTAILLSRKF